MKKNNKLKKPKVKSSTKKNSIFPKLSVELNGNVYIVEEDNNGKIDKAEVDKKIVLLILVNAIEMALKREFSTTKDIL